MAVKLRLTRMGSKKRPFYRIVAMDSRKQRDGNYIELIGTYNPLNGEVNVKREIAINWLKNGAIPSETVKNIFKKEGINKEFGELKRKEIISKNNSKDKKKAKSKIKAKKTTKKVVKKK